MARNFGVMSEREIDQCHKGLMGGMIDSDHERVLCSAEAHSKFDYRSTQREKERDVVSLTSNRQNANNYAPDHATQHQAQMRPGMPG